MAFFGLKTYFKKFSLGYFCPPIKVMSKNWVKMASKLVFIGGGAESAPPSPWDAFQMLPLVGLKAYAGIDGFIIKATASSFYLAV